MRTLEVRGYIAGNEMKEVLDWFGYENTTPGDIKSGLADLSYGEDVDVYINSGGGDVYAGTEIYSLLRGTPNVTVHVQSMAASAASVIAMGGAVVLMSPAAQIMVHNVSANYMFDGDYHEADKLMRDLKDTNAALAEAYALRTGKSKASILNLMDKETWLSAKKAIELGFADEIEPAGNGRYNLSNAFSSLPLTQKMIEQARKDMVEAKAKAAAEAEKQSILADLWKYGV